MTSPAGRAVVEILGDLSKFAGNLQRDLDKALRGLDVDAIDQPMKEIGRSAEKAFDVVDREARETTERLGDKFQASGETAERALSEVSAKSRTEFGQVERHAAEAGASIGSSLRRAAGVVAAAFVTLQVGRFFIDATQAAEDLGSAIANTGQIIKATGGSAKLLAEDIRTISQELSLKIGVDSVEVQNAANILLTFKGVSGNTFRTAIGLSADLSAVLGSDLKGAALQLGKALNDPVLGVGALSRAGVQFTPVQKAQIKGFVETNQLGKAQAVILKEVASQVGGVAEAGADTTDKLKVAFLDLRREAGLALITFIDDHGPQLISLIQKMEPVISQVGELLAGAFEAALPIIDVVVTSLRDNFAAVAPAMAPFADVLQSVLALLPGIIPPLVQITQAILPPLAAIIGAVAAALGPVIGQFIQLTARLVTALLPALGPIGDLLTQMATVVGGALLQVMPPLADAVLKLVVALLPLVPLAVDLLTAVLPLVPALAGIIAALAPLAGALAGPLGALAGFLADNAPLVITLAATMAAFAIATNASAIAVSALMLVGNLWLIATRIWTAAMWLLNIALDANPVGIVILAIGALVAVIVLAWQHSEGFRKAVIKVWESLKEAASTIAGAFVTAWKAVSAFFVGVWHWFQDLPDTIRDAFDTALNAVGAFFAGIGQWFAALPGRIGGFLASLPGLLLNLIGKMFNQALVGIGVGIGLLLAAFVIVPRLILNALSALPGLLWGFLKGVWDGAVRLAAQGIAALVTWVGSLWTRWWAILQAIPGQLAAYFTNLWNTAKTVTIAGIAAIVSFVTALPGRVWAAISALPGILRDAFTSALRAAREAVVSGFNTIVAFITSVPSRIAALAGRMASAGRSLIQGFMSGLKSVGNFIGDIAGSIVGAVKGFLNNVIGRINSGIASIDDALPFSLPRIPSLASGGITQREGLANLHPRELVLPLEDRRSVDLLARALSEADAGLRATGVMPPATPPALNVRIFVGTREITDIVRVELDESNRALRQRVTAGAGRR